MSCSLRGSHVRTSPCSRCPAPRSTSPGSRSPSRRPQTRRSASSSPTARSRAAASSKEHGGETPPVTARAPGPATGAAIARRRRRTSSVRSPGILDGSLAEHDGQVWGYDPDDQTLTLELYLPLNPDPASDIPDGPDNICVSPYGGFFLAEDGVGVQHLLAVDTTGQATPVRPQPPQLVGVHRRELRIRAARCCSPTSRTKGSASASPGRSTNSDRNKLRGVTTSLRRPAVPRWAADW